MSYDYVALIPEVAGTSTAETLQAAALLTENISDGPVDVRITAFHKDLTAIIDSIPDDQDAWVSMWPLAPGPTSLSIPVPYPSADEALLVLLRLAARHGLVLADLSSSAVDAPARGIPVSVKGGDGTRAGALTQEALTDAVHRIGGKDPWLVLDTGDRFAQTMHRADGSWILEHHDGTTHHQSVVATSDEVNTQLWRWLAGDPAFGEGVTFTPLTQDRRRPTNRRSRALPLMPRPVRT